ncbi:MAG: threonylcarbamoyl-AMP synthase [Candidatus Latescibacteria bacterium]|nr:threonylcarbamoyl-AMP synthase [Candidatus Latescibacterota bacterium]
MVERVRLAANGNTAEVAARAAAVLRAGGVALLPAEGIYGLHVLAADLGAVARLRALKPRDAARGFIGLMARPEALKIWAKAGERAQALARAHWPGALTLVLEASPAVPDSLRTKAGTVALRCPGAEFLRAVVEGVQGLVISTSANATGEPPLVRAEGPLTKRVDLVVDGGELSGVPSTVAEVSGERVRVLREGAVRLEGRFT